jgi:ankyrin repeat protein
MRKVLQDNDGNVADALAAAAGRAQGMAAAQVILHIRPRVRGYRKAMSKALLNLCQSGTQSAPLRKVRLLYELEADADATDEFGRTPLHYAAQHGWTGVASFLLVHCRSAASRRRDDDGHTPLSRACIGADSEKSLEMVRLLLRHGEDPRLAKHAPGDLYDQCQALQVDSDIFRVLVRAGAWAPRPVSPLGDLAVYLAALHSEHSQLLWFATAGFDFQGVPQGQFYNPFCAAASVGHLATMKRLVRLGMDYSLLFDDDTSPLHAFASSPFVGEDSAEEVVKFLVVTCGVDPNLRESTPGATALHKAAQYGRSHVMHALLSYGSYVDSTDAYGALSVFSMLPLNRWRNTNTCARSTQ